jgi:hypothetical protein
MYFRADAGFANPEVSQCLEAEQIKYAIRLGPTDSTGSDRLPAQAPSRATAERGARFHANFTYQAGSCSSSAVQIARGDGSRPRHPPALPERRKRAKNSRRSGFIWRISAKYSSRRCAALEAHVGKVYDLGSIAVIPSHSAPTTAGSGRLIDH